MLRAGVASLFYRVLRACVGSLFYRVLRACVGISHSWVAKSNAPSRVQCGALFWLPQARYV